MIEEDLLGIYSKFKLMFYKRIFSRFENREATLTAVEVFCVDAIHSLGNPTIVEFANFVNISQANATYKINSLEKKGYVTRKRSDSDKREIHLAVTEKFLNYYGLTTNYVRKVADRMKERFSPEQIAQFKEFVRVIDEELMDELDSVSNQ